MIEQPKCNQTHCYECGTELEMWIETMGGRLYERQQLYCPKCKAGCGYADD